MLQLAREHLSPEHRALDVALEVVQAHPLAPELALELRVVRDVVLLLDAVDHVQDVFGAELDAEVGGALGDEQVVHRFLEDARVVLPEVGLDLFGRDARRLHGRELARLELGLRDDVAVHLGHDALDDLGAGGGGEGEEAGAHEGGAAKTDENR